MNDITIAVIKAAYADLVGALQARNSLDMEAHDWKAHMLTIAEMEAEFKFIEPANVSFEGEE
jgi:hypothetical protein